MRKNLRKRLLFLTLIGLTCVAALLARAKVQSSERGKPLYADLPRTEVVAPGHVEGRDRTLNLGFEQSGRITQLPIREGQQVAKGQLLATLDDRIAKARLAQAEAALMAARARRDLAFKGSRAEELRAAEADLEAARAQAKNQSLEHGRAERLTREKAIPVAENDRLRAAADASSAQVSAAEARLSMLREGTRGELKRAAIAELAGAEATVDEARTLVSQMRLIAPCDGVVVRRFVSEGELVSLVPPTIVVSLADLSHLRLRAEIDEEDIVRVVIGQTGFTTAQAFDGKHFSGRIVEKMGDVGRKGIRSDDDPRARVDTRVLEVLFEFDGTVSLPLGLRMDLHLPITGTPES